MTTPLRKIRVRLQAHPGDEVLAGPNGEMQNLAGVEHVSVFKPYDQLNGGPDHAYLYTISAVNALNGQSIRLQNMRFGGIGPHTRAARFADR